MAARKTKIKTNLAFFDLDGTLTTTRSPWRLLLESYKKWDPVGKKNLSDFLAGKFPGSAADQYNEFCRRDAELLKGMSRNHFNSVLQSIKFRINISTLTHWLKTKNTQLILISAGFTYLAKLAYQKYQFDAYHANELLFSDGTLDGQFKVTVGWHGKQPIVRQYKQHYLDHGQLGITIAFGDTSGDIPMFDEVDYSFACFEATEDTINAATYHITDFTEALIILKSLF